MRRYNDRDDRFVLATLARAFLRSAQWLPVSEPGQRTKIVYAAAGDAWTHSEDVPPFATVIVSALRALLAASPHSAARAGGLGIRSWDDRSRAHDRVRLLADLIQAGALAEGVLPPFRRAYDDAWADVADLGAGLPWRPADRRLLVVACSHRLEAAEIGAGDERVYAQDTDERQNLSLLEQCRAPAPGPRIRRPSPRRSKTATSTPRAARSGRPCPSSTPRSSPSARRRADALAAPGTRSPRANTARDGR